MKRVVVLISVVVLASVSCSPASYHSKHVGGEPREVRLLPGDTTEFTLNLCHSEADEIAWADLAVVLNRGNGDGDLLVVVGREDEWPGFERFALHGLHTLVLGSALGSDAADDGCWVQARVRFHLDRAAPGPARFWWRPTIEVTTDSRTDQFTLEVSP